MDTDNITSFCGTVLFKSQFIGSQMSYPQTRNRLTDTAENTLVVAQGKGSGE